jgi:hypothetical protein
MFVALGLACLAAMTAMKVAEFRQVRDALEACTPDRCAAVGEEQMRRQVESLGGPDEATRKLSFYLHLPKRWAHGKWIAVRLLGSCGESALPELRRLLDDEDGSMRRVAAESLGRVGGHRALHALAVALEDRDPSVRYGAVSGLSVIGGPRAVELLGEALKDKDTNVRRHAREVLERIRNRRRDLPR